MAEPSVTPRQVAGDTPAVLADVLHDGINLAIWNRCLPLHIEQFARMLTGVAEPFAQSLVVQLEDAEAEPNLSQLAGTHKDLEGHEGFVADVAWLVKAFAYLLNARRVGVRLRLLDKAMCPRFHVDHVPLRLVTTYSGPGSLWSGKSQLTLSLWTKPINSRQVQWRCSRVTSGRATKGQASCIVRLPWRRARSACFCHWTGWLREVKSLSLIKTYVVLIRYGRKSRRLVGTVDFEEGLRDETLRPCGSAEQIDTQLESNPYGQSCRETQRDILEPVVPVFTQQ